MKHCASLHEKNIMEKFAYFTDALKKYTKFDGRSNLSEFWYFTLINLIISIILASLNSTIGNLYSLAVLIPTLAIGTRRLHDIGKSGWMQLVALIPIAGWIWIIVLFAKKGDENNNEYGAPSKGLTVDSKNDLKDITKKASLLGKKVADKVEDLGEKVTDKVEDFGEKAKDVIEDIKE
jgi:uncharacterized membrane protein YhaH (DUF805 family)